MCRAALAMACAIGLPLTTAPASETPSVRGAGPEMGSAPVASKAGLTLAGARRVIAGARAEAAGKAGTGVIAVVDEGGNLVALERLEGTFPAGAEISIGKARTAAMFRKPTRFFEEAIKNGRVAMTAMPERVGFTPLQGGVPLVVDGQVVGGVGVSGAASAAQDEELALAGAAALLGPARGTEAPTAYFDAERVRESFARGVPLFRGSEGADCEVHTSRRDAPGVPEVHEHEADVIYVTQGTATMVTGGTLVGGAGVGEVRGGRLEGGEARVLSAGEVIVIPRCTPHWFKEVRGPFLYYLVKIR